MFKHWDKVSRFTHNKDFLWGLPTVSVPSNVYLHSPQVNSGPDTSAHSSRTHRLQTLHWIVSSLVDSEQMKRNQSWESAMLESAELDFIAPCPVFFLVLFFLFSFFLLFSCRLPFRRSCILALDVGSGNRRLISFCLFKKLPNHILLAFALSSLNTWGIPFVYAIWNARDIRS